MSVYDEIADFFLSTMVGQLSGATREQIIAKAKATWPTEALARQRIDELLEEANKTYEDMLAHAEQKKKARH
jgi:hypothetical protein